MYRYTPTNDHGDEGLEPLSMKNLLTALILTAVHPALHDQAGIPSQVSGDTAKHSGQAWMESQDHLNPWQNDNIGYKENKKSWYSALQKPDRNGIRNSIRTKIFNKKLFEKEVFWCSDSVTSNLGKHQAEKELIVWVSSSNGNGPSWGCGWNTKPALFKSLDQQLQPMAEVQDSFILNQAQRYRHRDTTHTDIHTQTRPPQTDSHSNADTDTDTHTGADTYTV